MAKAVFKVVVFYHVTIVAIGHGLLNKNLAFVNRLRSMHCSEVFIELNYVKVDPG